MQRTLKDIYALVMARRNWQPKASNTVTKIKQTFANALSALATCVEGAMVEDKYRTILYKTIDSSIEGIEINATVDPLVLKITRTGGLGLLTWVPMMDGTWDGSMWLEITTTRTVDGTSETVYETRQTLDWWSVLTNAGTTHYVSIDRPWPNTTDTALAFRIYQKLVWLPSEVISLVRENSLVFSDQIRSTTRLTITSHADTYDVVQPVAMTAGRPTMIFKDDTYIEQAPSVAPTVVAATTGLGVPVPWVGPVQEGTFEFYYTICWGKMSSRWQQAKNGTSDCLFESHPSPISSAFSNTTYPGQAVTITVTNPDQMRGFADASKLSYGHSGRFIRLYVRRTALRTAGLGSYNHVEADSVPYLLTEFNATTASSTFTWDGSVVPEFTRRMKFTSGLYSALGVYPVADRQYEVAARVQYTPPDMLSESDIIPVHSLAIPAFLEFCEAEAARIDGADLKSYNQLRSEALRQGSALRARLMGTVVVDAIPYESGSFQGERIYQKIPTGILGY
jgi:hypothetical protein